MRKTPFIALLLFFALHATGQIKWNAKYQAYIDQYHDLAIEQMQKYGIPASITLAQGLYESGAGLSRLTRESNNHFGIKCHGWRGEKTYHDDETRNECFRAYDSAYDSYEDHSKFLAGGKRYKKLFSLKRTDYKGWARGLSDCGYATNPAYAKKLIEIIKLYGLHKYDKAKKYDKLMVRRTRQGGGKGSYLASRTITENNKSHYVKARAGDTFRSLSKELGISRRKLAKYNERDKDATLEDGEIIYIDKKQRRAAKEYKKRPHTVKAGESMYSISQLYGIRLNRLYKMNGLDANYSIKVGDKLRVR